jgi:hypothetical protein
MDHSADELVKRRICIVSAILGKLHAALGRTERDARVLNGTDALVSQTR